MTWKFSSMVDGACWQQEDVVTLSVFGPHVPESEVDVVYMLYSTIVESIMNASHETVVTSGLL